MNNFKARFLFKNFSGLDHNSFGDRLEDGWWFKKKRRLVCATRSSAEK